MRVLFTCVHESLVKFVFRTITHSCCLVVLQGYSLYSDCDGSYNYATTGKLCPEWISDSSVSPVMQDVMRESLASSAKELLIVNVNSSMYWEPVTSPIYSLVSSAVTPMVLTIGVLLRDEFRNPIVEGSSDANATITANIDDARVKFIGKLHLPQ